MSQQSFIITDGSNDVAVLNSSPSGTEYGVAVRIIGAAAGGTSSSFTQLFPGSGTAVGFNDGTNMQGARVYDAYTGAGTEYVLGTNLRFSANGGSVEAGTASNPLRIDPTGTTSQPVSIKGLVDANNSTTTPLGSNATFTGTATDVLDYATVSILVTSDKASANEGAQVQFSSDGANWDDESVYTFVPGSPPREGRAFVISVRGRYMRVKYTNTNSAQTYFRLQTVLQQVALSPTFLQLGDAPGDTNYGILTKSVIAGHTTSGGGAYVDVKVTPSGAISIDGTVSATQSGTWTVQPGNTANTTPWLTTISQGGNSAFVTGANALKVDGSAVTQPISGTITANIGTTGGLALDATVAALQVSQGSTTSGQSGSLIQGSVTTAAPSYTNAQTSPLSLTTAGALRVDNSAVTQPVSGTITANQGGSWTTTVTQAIAANLNATVTGTVAATQSGTWTVQPGNTQNTTPWLTQDSADGPVTPGAVATMSILIGAQYNTAPPVLTNTQQAALQVDSSGRLLVGSIASALPTGSNVIGAVTQSAGPWTQNITQFGSSAVATGTGASGSGIPRVTVANDSNILATQSGTWTVQQGSPPWSVKGTAAAGTIVTDAPIPVAGIDDDGYARYLLTDNTGKLEVVFSATSGTPVTRRITQNIATNTTVYNDYTVPGGSTFKVSAYYVGGTGVCRSTLAKHTSATVTFISNGDFENAGQITPWAAVTGTFGGGTPDSNGTQFQTGAASMRWTYSNSATALVRRQTFSPVQDFSGYRYIRVKFYNDTVAATTRTISVILTAGTPTRTYSLSGTTGSGLFTNNTWVTLTCELENPTSATGTGFDLTSISAIALSMQDAANRSGTVYWDTLRQEDQIEVRHRIYTSTGDTVSAPLNPSEEFVAGESVYLIVRNTGNTAQEFTAIAAGTLT